MTPVDLLLTRTPIEYLCCWLDVVGCVGWTPIACFLVVPDTPSYPTYAIRTFFGLRWDNRIAENRDAPIRINFNTLLNLGSVTASSSEVNGFTDAIIGNNILHSPSTSPPSIPFAPLNSNTVFTPRELGYKDDDTPLQSDYATPASSVWGADPNIGSSAIGGSQLLPPPYDDFYGNIRTQLMQSGNRNNPTLGAIEPE